MASLPGVPGNLGLPPSGDPANPAGGGNSDLPLGAETSTALKLAHDTFISTFLFALPNTSLSGSVTIPSTTVGNLVVVFLKPTFRPDEFHEHAHLPIEFTLGANAGDSPIAIPDAGDETLDTGYQNSALRSWYWVSGGGATTLNWSVTGYDFGQGPAPSFWVYEVTGATSWEMVEADSAYRQDEVDDLPPPWFGPLITSSAEHNIYFTVAWAGEQDVASQPDAIQFVSPYTTDSVGFSSPNYVSTVSNIIGYIADDTGDQQAEYNHGSSTSGYLSFSVVLSGSGGGGGGGTPPPDVDQFLPNVWIIS